MLSNLEGLSAGFRLGCKPIFFSLDAEAAAVEKQGKKPQSAQETHDIWLWETVSLACNRA